MHTGFPSESIFQTKVHENRTQRTSVSLDRGNRDQSLRASKIEGQSSREEGALNLHKNFSRIFGQLLMCMCGGGRPSREKAGEKTGEFLSHMVLERCGSLGSVRVDRPA